MPHVTVEWTDNLAQDGRISVLLSDIAAMLREHPDVFPWGGIRVRGIRLTDYVIADGAEDDAFVHITVRIGRGRDAQFKAEFFAKLFEGVKAHFAEVSARRFLALSMYVEEVEGVLSFKHNNLHARFRTIT